MNVILSHSNVMKITKWLQMIRNDFIDRFIANSLIGALTGHNGDLQTITKKPIDF